jgi:nitrate/nitrite transport system ATP-binding protein
MTTKWTVGSQKREVAPALTPESQACLSAKGLFKAFGTGAQARAVLRNVSLSVQRGEFVCIVGAMGTGKTTLLNMLAGIVRPDAGVVEIDGRPVVDIPARAAFVFQNYSLLPWFTALENVRLAVEAARPTQSKAAQRERAMQALEQVGLGNASHRRPAQLSGGMRQRVALARGLATDPDILFLDEPFGALDALTRETLQGELARLSLSDGQPVTTLMVTNNVEEAILLADRIVPMVSGPPATLGTPIPITLPRPRTVANLAHDEEASICRAHVIATLTAALGRRKSVSTNSGGVQATTALELGK